MSAFDFDKILSAAANDLDQESRERISQALTAAVEAAEREAGAKANQATKEALERLTAALQSHEAKAENQASNDAQRLTHVHRQAVSLIREEQAAVERQAASTVQSVEQATKNAHREATKMQEVTKQAIQKTKTATQTAALLEKARFFLIAGAVFAILGLIAASWAGVQIGQRSAQSAYAAEFARLDEVALSHESRIAELVEQESTALSEAHEMADIRDTINAEMTRLVELREEIGLELVRDNRAVEIRLGDVMLRPWRGRTLVIIDEGRQLEAFSGGAALNDVARYRGRMFKTQPAE